MKPEVVFGLEDAAWPALLVDASGKVLMRNAAAGSLFGTMLDGSPGNLNAVWASANGTQPSGFLAWWERNQRTPVDIQYRAAGGIEKKFATVIAMAKGEEEKNFLLQLLA